MTSIIQKLAAISLSLLAIPLIAVPMLADSSQSPERSARLIDNQTDLSWVLNGEEDGQGRLGYACLTRNRLMADAGASFITRYAIVRNASGELTLTPIIAAKVIRQGQGYVSLSDRYVVEALEPMAEASIWQIVRHRTMRMNRPFEPGLTAENQPRELGQACLDGGIAGSIDWLERTNNITIEDTREPQ
ncbi:MAG TPA: hypothetical protein V6C84_14230 [Coleofasciculaceae cyanobacterium]|jgi:hypothetical protein